MIPATRENAQTFLDDLKTMTLSVQLVGDLRRGEANPSERVDILVVPDPNNLDALKDYVNNTLGKVMHGKVGPNDELSHTFPAKFLKVTGRMKMAIWFCPPREFGLRCFRLTGPAYFVQRAMAYWKVISKGGSDSGGLLIDKLGNVVETNSEEQLFGVLKCKWIEPEKRK